MSTIFDTGATMRCRMMSKKQRAHFLREYLGIKKYDWIRLPYNVTEPTKNLIAKLDTLIRGKEPINEETLTSLKLLYQMHKEEKEALTISSTEMPS